MSSNTPIVKLSNSFTTNLQIRKLTESSPQDSTTCQPLSNSDIKSRTCVGGLQHSKAKKKVKHFSTKCDQNFKRMQIFFHFTPNPRKTPTLDIRRHSNQVKKRYQMKLDKIRWVSLERFFLDHLLLCFKLLGNAQRMSHLLARNLLTTSSLSYYL